MFHSVRNKLGEMKCVIERDINWKNKMSHLGPNLLGKMEISHSGLN